MIAPRIKDAYHEGWKAGYEQAKRDINGTVPGEYKCPECGKSNYPNYGNMCAFCGVKTKGGGNGR